MQATHKRINESPRIQRGLKELIKSLSKAEPKIMCEFYFFE